MKRVVVYQSKTGFTKQYAQWIAEALDCKAVERSSVNEETLQQYDQVIYGGSLAASRIIGYDKIKQMNLKNVVVFAVGFAPQDDKMTEKLKTENQVESSPLFYFRGGICYEKLNFFFKIMLKKITKTNESKDYSDKKYIDELITYLI